jgi:zinc and cadmium transporter
MQTLLCIIVATFTVSLISLAGTASLFLSKNLLDKVLLILVALAGGGLIGGAFLHLIPESIHEIGNDPESVTKIFAFVLIGFLFFLLIEQFLHWHHHNHGSQHTHECSRDTKHISQLIIFGDGIHNIIDGLIIAASFMVDIKVGVVTTIAVALHEIPQEIGDFGVLVYGGYRRTRALALNFFSGLTAVAGGVFGFIFAEKAEQTMLFLLPIAAGGFIYIAASDLIPEIKDNKKASRLTWHFLVFLAGILIVFAMKLIPFAEH